MNAHRCPLDGILLIDLDVHEDERGFFVETYERARYESVGIHDTFIQHNQSRSRRNVLRGMHFTRRHAQSQLVTVVRGHIFDVVVDIRLASPTFGRWFGSHLTENGVRQIYMPHGFAHGFCVLSDVADVHYSVSQVYRRNDQGGIAWNDPAVGVDWPIRDPIMAEKDRAYSGLEQFVRGEGRTAV